MIGFSLGVACYQMLDSGLANIFVVETLKHGTDPLSYLQIRLQGPNPEYSISESPSTPFNQRHFFVIKENAALFHSIIWPRFFSGTSAWRRCDRSLKPFPKSVRNLISVIGALSSSLLTPTLNFRFCKHELQENNRFKNDQGFLGIPPEQSPAYATQCKIETWRIGLIGTFLVGLNHGLFERIQKNPHRFIKGAIQLTGATALIWYSSSSSSTVSFIAGALLG